MVKPTTSCILEDKDKILLNEFMKNLSIRCPNPKCNIEHDLILTKHQYNEIYDLVGGFVVDAYNMAKGRSK
jgi:hypothetical protein